MTHHIDIEWVLAAVIASYLSTNLDQSITVTCPVVTWYDPMSQDDASRIVVTVPDGETEDDIVGNGDFSVEVNVKSQWTQPTLAADQATHRNRVVAVRSLLWTDTLIADIGTAAAALDESVGINMVYYKRRMRTEVMDQWLDTVTTLRFNIFSTET